jgi:hypothetical protein
MRIVLVKVLLKTRKIPSFALLLDYRDNLRSKITRVVVLYCIIWLVYLILDLCPVEAT